MAPCHVWFKHFILILQNTKHYLYFLYVFIKIYIIDITIVYILLQVIYLIFYVCLSTDNVHHLIYIIYYIFLSIENVLHKKIFYIYI